MGINFVAGAVRIGINYISSIHKEHPSIGVGGILENQAVEWKESWHDDHMRTICAFANGNGGVLEIGRRDDGTVVGVPNVRKLLGDLPNKVKNAMAIVVNLDVREANSNQYIIMTVRGHPFPISYHGVYYIRSGSTTQGLTGSALDEFMLRKQGKTWDGVPVPYVDFGDFESDAFRAFRRKAIDSTRLTAQDLDISNERLLDTLQLTEGRYFKRAAILLFHQDPEKWVPGAYVKIGMFESGADLRYQHEIHGPLITMPDRVMETVYLNYFKGIISYEGIQRIETYPVPHAAFREAITNAIVHRDYSKPIPIQIKVFPNKVIIYNDGILPLGWTVEDLKKTHRSQPHNPYIASAFFRSGQIESWGRGIEKIAVACEAWGKPAPEINFKYDREFSLTFYANIGINADAPNNVVDTPIDVTIKNREDNINALINADNALINGNNNALINDTKRAILNLLSTNPNVTIAVISTKLGIHERNIRRNIESLKEAGLIERIGPKKTGHWVVKLH
ncbi:MAG: putative DNA binding domain-containing protein [Bacteroidales bacterium]|nr:putative DNA binding domain-containing protein [Bacteroidales bacterium]